MVFFVFLLISLWCYCAGKNCEVDINECQLGLCINGATCVDGINDFQCECMPGFRSVHGRDPDCCRGFKSITLFSGLSSLMFQKALYCVLLYIMYYDVIGYLGQNRCFILNFHVLIYV